MKNETLVKIVGVCMMFAVVVIGNFINVSSVPIVTFNYFIIRILIK